LEAEARATPREIGKCGRCVACVREHRRLECAELGLQHALVSFVLLAAVVADKV
jgi:hypothetical protein